MKNLLLSFVLFFPLFSICQPTITSSVHLPKIGQSFNTVYFSAEVDSFIIASPGSAGANRTWNYSSLKTGEESPFDYVDPNKLKLQNEIKAIGANLAMRSIDRSEEGELAVYLLQSATTTQISSKAITDDSLLLFPYNPVPISMKFPFRFGDKFTTKSGYLLGDSVEFFSVKSNITVEADAYGNIATADGTYNNVLRVKKTSIDSTSVNFIGLEFDFVDTTTFYEWYAVDKTIPVFTLETMLLEGVSQTRGYSYLKSKTTSSSLSEIENVEVYPNPFYDNLQVKNITDINKHTIMVYDLTGRQMIKQNLEEGKSPNVDLSNLPKGPYILQISSESGIKKSFKVMKE